MRIADAPQLLSAAVHTVIALQMARELYRNRADLSSEASVSRVLSEAGFGVPSILKLRRRAVSAARVIAEHGGERQ